MQQQFIKGFLEGRQPKRCSHGVWYGNCMYGCQDPYKVPPKNYDAYHYFNKKS